MTKDVIFAALAAVGLLAVGGVAASFVGPPGEFASVWLALVSFVLGGAGICFGGYALLTAFDRVRGDQ